MLPLVVGSAVKRNCKARDPRTQKHRSQIRDNCVQTFPCAGQRQTNSLRHNATADGLSVVIRHLNSMPLTSRIPFFAVAFQAPLTQWF